MSWIGWIGVGFLAGALAGWVTRAERQGCIATTVIGMIGALIGGGLFRLAGATGPGSFVTAFLGAVLLLLVLRALGAPRRT